MSRTRWLRSLLELSGGVQLLLALLGTFGLNLAAALAVAKVIAPNTPWDYLMLAAVFAALTPVTFPLSAFALNLALSQVEKARKKVILDNPTETARKTIDSLIEEAKMLGEQLPVSTYASQNERAFTAERWAHFAFRADHELLRAAGQYAAHCFSTDTRTNAWGGDAGNSPDAMRDRVTEALRAFHLIRDDLPFDRRKYLRFSFPVDIAAGRALCVFLRAAPDDADDSYGVMQVLRWAGAVYNSSRREGVDAAYQFAPDTYSSLSTVAERLAYAEDRIAELDRLWRAL